MGSKKLKKKKIKSNKIGKLRRLKAIKIRKSGNFVGRKKLDRVKTLRQKNVSDRLLNKKYSRSCIGEKYISKVKIFSKIRERYFSYLQSVVTDNCLYYESPVTGDKLENLSIELEQHALLACLQADIYKKSMTKIISDIEKSSKEKKVHKEVKKLLPVTTAPLMKTESSSLPAVEHYSQIPTISTTRTDGDFSINGSAWTGQLVYSSQTSDPYLLEYQEAYPDTHMSQVDLGWGGRESYASNPTYWNGEVTQGSFPSFESPVMSSNLVQLGRDAAKPKPISRVPPQTLVETEKPDPLIASRNQLKKSVEKTLSHTYKVNKERKDEKERAYIAQILEGDDSLDDRLGYDSLSDNENESKENVDESNLTDRLEKMRELFGVEEGETVEAVAAKPKAAGLKPCPPRIRRPTIWKHEKIIHMYKFSMLSSEMTSERRKRNRKLFLELFGEDSDEEHEDEYRCPEKYRASCTERISSWVVKYLMPFYHDKKIVGRNVFKSLGHHISDSIVDKIQYPDEWSVKYSVSRFFPPQKIYVCDADVLAFQPE